jgi:5-methylcytosine-specific restriction endonuclease McrBC regulatory subunit McrC
MAQTNLNLTIKAENIIADVKWQFAKKGQKMNKHEIINHIIETWKSKS